MRNYNENISNITLLDIADKLFDTTPFVLNGCYIKLSIKDGVTDDSNLMTISEYLSSETTEDESTTTTTPTDTTPTEGSEDTAGNSGSTDPLDVVPANTGDNTTDTNTSTGTETTTQDKQITMDNLVVEFRINTDKEQPSSTNDGATPTGTILGSFYKKSGRYYLHVKQSSTFLNIVNHDSSLFRLTLDDSDVTLQTIRDLIGKFRALYYYDDVDESEDIIPLIGGETEMEDFIARLETYIDDSVDDGYIFNLTVNSLREANSGDLVKLGVRSINNPALEKDILSIQLHSGNYEPAVLIQTNFSNELNGYDGNMDFLNDGTPIWISGNVATVAEGDEVIKAVITKISQLTNYSYIV